MLPFLKRRNEASVSMPAEVERREPDDDADNYDVMHSVAQDLCDAIHSKNIKAIAEALKAAFELAESDEPHEEESK